MTDGYRPARGKPEVLCMKQKFDITGMSCAACSAHVEKAVRKLEGIRSADVSLMTNSMTCLLYTSRCV